MSWWKRWLVGAAPSFDEAYIVVVVRDMQRDALVARRFLPRGTPVRIGAAEDDTLIHEQLDPGFVLMDANDRVNVPPGLPVTTHILGSQGPTELEGHTEGLIDAQLCVPWIQIDLPGDFRLTLQLTDVLYDDTRARIPRRGPPRRFVDQHQIRVVIKGLPGGQPMIRRTYPRGTPIRIGPDPDATIPYPHLPETVTLLDADERVTALASWYLHCHGRDPGTGEVVQVEERLKRTWRGFDLLSQWIVVRIPGLQVAVALLSERLPDMGTLPVSATNHPVPDGVWEVEIGGDEPLVIAAPEDLDEWPSFNPSDFTALYGLMGVVTGATGPHRIEVHVDPPGEIVLDRPFTQLLETYSGELLLGTPDDVTEHRHPIPLPSEGCFDVTLGRHPGKHDCFVVVIRETTEVYRPPAGLRRILPMGMDQEPWATETHTPTDTATLLVYDAEDPGIEPVAQDAGCLCDIGELDIVQRRRLIAWSTGYDGSFSMRVRRTEHHPAGATVFPFEVTGQRVWVGGPEYVDGRLGPPTFVGMENGSYSVGVSCDPDRPSRFLVSFVPVDTPPPPQSGLPRITT